MRSTVRQVKSNPLCYDAMTGLWSLGGSCGLVIMSSGNRGHCTTRGSFLKGPVMVSSLRVDNSHVEHTVPLAS